MTMHSLGAGPVLVLAHGAGGSVLDNYATLATHLPDRLLLGRDYPGSGGRPPQPEPLDLDALADELVTGAVEAGHERFPVLGLSMGAAVAVTAAARHPERVSGLVLTVGLAYADAQARAFADLYARLARAGTVDELARLLVLTQSPRTLGALDENALDALLTELAGPAEEAAALAPQMDLVARVDTRPLLPQVAVPTLVVVGGEDRILLPASVRLLADGIPGAELVELPEAGHIFTPEETAVWAGHVRTFLENHRL